MCEKKMSKVWNYQAKFENIRDCEDVYSTKLSGNVKTFKVWNYLEMSERLKCEIFRECKKTSKVRNYQGMWDRLKYETITEYENV